MNENVVLVDKNDQQIGVIEKIAAHKEGILHRAFSVFIFNSQGKMLLQRRFDNKYHSGGLWSNACCGHPLPNEITGQAAHRRLKEELGFDCRLEELFQLLYKTDVGNDLIEHEYDHVFSGDYDLKIKPNPKEISEIRWMNIREVSSDVKKNSDKYTSWFRIIFPKLCQRLRKIA
jgi:isopentenyl-diphosphate delta-isomerase